MFISTAIVNVLPRNKPTLEETNSIVLLEQSVQMCVTQRAVFCASFYRFYVLYFGARTWENKNDFLCARLNSSVLPFFFLLYSIYRLVWCLNRCSIEYFFNSEMCGCSERLSCMGSVFKCADFLSRCSLNASLLGAKDARKKKSSCVCGLYKRILLYKPL